MEPSSSSTPSSPQHRPAASFATQADALLRKNLTLQKRNLKNNVCIISFPVLICVLLVVLQGIIDKELDKPENRCGCACVESGAGNGSCRRVCGIQYSTMDQVGFCSIPNPPRWSSLLQVPLPEYRAVRMPDSTFSTDWPDKSCRSNGSCPATVLITGQNRTLSESLAGHFFREATSLDSLDYLDALSSVAPGTDAPTGLLQFIEPAFASDTPLYLLQPHCRTSSMNAVTVKFENVTLQKDVKCVQGLSLWLDNASEVNNELYKGYQQANADRKSNEFVAAFDFSNTSENAFNVNIWYNSTYRNDSTQQLVALVRMLRSVNMVSNAYLQSIKGNGTMMRLEYVKEMPKSETRIRLNFSALLGALFFTWIVQLLFPVMLTYLVYEKQQKLKIMMKMHGLKDGPYWLISYAYFFVLSSVYMLCFVIFGSLIGLKFFTLNDYSIQFVFYFIYINLQIALAFVAASFFSDLKITSVAAYIYVFGSGLIGQFFSRYLVEDDSFPRHWLVVIELVPGLSLHRGLYEFGQYAFTGDSTNTSGMHWGNLGDSMNGLKNVLLTMTIEWLLLLLLAHYLDQISSFSVGRRNPGFNLKCIDKKDLLSSVKSMLQRQSSKVFIGIDRPDVAKEREVVEQLLLEHSNNHAIICDNLNKKFPGRDGSPEKLAVQGLSLAVPSGECFGMLGPNGAGKTSFINMMTGLLTPTSGTALVEGLDIRSNMDEIYASMGVCPQHDLLWETLTGREHLLFYARLKNLKGAALIQAVEESLKSVNLFHGGVADKQVGKYSGGMKRRLSVAISLIGDPKVVYMDEPSTGLDPASRNNLWNVIKNAKKDRAIVLTTHSMEEAEVLCDRLGIFVTGSLQCIGNPKELKARYGGTYVFTMTTSSNEEEEVDLLVQKLSPNAKKIYQISGTQKYELPKQEVKIANVFRAVEHAKVSFTVQAWGLADTTLEDVFIKVAKGVPSHDNALI
ncbi:LOW QUALITY PROTEIN: ABC transporter A family member 7-like [Dendrobium catenatum]|uniref:LOW QUALITY PROTEIN: ABC transporter A family member 7-like n=1 Tax=Dendrobium catenatum TaxID=906689 RepID=UPI0009F18AC5|nr:LOW QUALITY PROTEIN: ABC transporter A family member 7-like [Dendrobium catenatum]